MTMSRFRRMLLASACACLITLSVASFPAAAFVVFDPSNYAKNVIQAARALEQINNQITSLQNEAEMLINQARNLAKLPYSALQSIQDSISRTQELLGQAQRLAYDVQQIEEEFGKLYSSANLSAPDRALVDGAEQRWKNSVAGFEDALKVQAGVVGGLDVTRDELGKLVTRSQSATGALQAAQAGNQLLALQAKQLADLTAVIAAQSRADSLEAARAAASEEQAREQFRRFLSKGQGYQSSPVKMFHDR
jgi:P-type conjugative transfer protein TrbJ